MKRIHIVGRALAVGLALLLSVTALAGVVYLLGTSQTVMLRLMQRYASPESSGLPAAEYPAMAEMITAYLRGEQETFQLVYTVDGAEYLAFHDYEQQHMADVQELFTLCRSVLFGGLAASAALLAFLLMRGDSRCVRSVTGGLMTVLVLVTIIAVQAVIDFDGMFRFFHRIAFDNNLWMLNPRTDLLIRLMPTGFFVSYAAMIGLGWLAMMVAAVFTTGLLERRMKNKEGRLP